MIRICSSAIVDLVLNSLIPSDFTVISMFIVLAREVLVFVPNYTPIALTNHLHLSLLPLNIGMREAACYHCSS